MLRPDVGLAVANDCKVAGKPRSYSCATAMRLPGDKGGASIRGKNSAPQSENRSAVEGIYFVDGLTKEDFAAPPVLNSTSVPSLPHAPASDP